MSTDSTPRRLGKYELQECLGRGGMGEVWKAWDTQLQRYVAIKILHANLQSDPDFVTRFFREAQAVASLRHPNIVQIYDFQVSHDLEPEGSLAYMVMEYIEGPTLADYIAHTSRVGQFPSAEEIIHLFTFIGMAVDYAHRHGVLHRDIKPANILLDQRNTVRYPMGEPVLTDFGIAKLLNATSGAATGFLTGTPLYIAPERAQGHVGEGRSDIYSLGVILYEICTGVRPFRGETAVSILRQHISTMPTSPSLINPAISPALAEVILRCLAKDPAARFPDARSLSAALERALSMPSPPASSPVSPLLPANTVPMIDDSTYGRASSPELPAPHGERTAQGDRQGRPYPERTEPPPGRVGAGLAPALGGLVTESSATRLQVVSDFQPAQISASPADQQDTPTTPTGIALPGLAPALGEQGEQGDRQGRPSPRRPEPPAERVGAGLAPALPGLGEQAPALPGLGEQAPALPGLAQATHALPLTSTHIPSSRPAATARKSGRRWLIALVIIMMIAIVSSGLGGFYWLTRQSPPTTPVSSSVGQAFFVSSGQLNQQGYPGINDELQINLYNIPDPAPGTAYYAWLLGDTTQPASMPILLGKLSVQHGEVHFLYPGDAQHTNLLAVTSRVLITQEDAGLKPINPAPDFSTWQYYAELPQQPDPNDVVHHYSMLNHLRSLLAEDPDAATMGIHGGLEVWLLRNTGKVVEWANSARDDWSDPQSTDLMRAHFIRILDYLDGDSYVQADVPTGTPLVAPAPIGLLGPATPTYASQGPSDFLHMISAHLNAIAQAPGATPDERKLAAQVNTGMENVGNRLATVRADAKQLLSMTDAQLHSQQALSVLNEMVTQAFYAYVGQLDPTTNQVQAGAVQINYATEQLATFDIKPFKPTT
jgi:serine/threonine protein kinase